MRPTKSADIPQIHREYGNEIGNKAQAVLAAVTPGELRHAHDELDAATSGLGLSDRHRLLSLIFPT